MSQVYKHTQGGCDLIVLRIDGSFIWLVLLAGATLADDDLILESGWSKNEGDARRAGMDALLYYCDIGINEPAQNEDYGD